MTRNGEIPVRYDYSMEHLDALAKLAGVKAWTHGLDPWERTALAWEGIVTALYGATTRPTSAMLMQAGTRAVLAWSSATQRSHGVRWHHPWAGPGSSPRFAKYWWHPVTPSPEEEIVEKLALVQVWPTLTPLQQESLVALAVHGTYIDAAAAVGVGYFTFYGRVREARRRFFKSWYQHQTPAAPPGYDTRRGA